MEIVLDESTSVLEEDRVNKINQAKLRNQLFEARGQS